MEDYIVVSTRLNSNRSEHYYISELQKEVNKKIPKYFPVGGICKGAKTFYRAMLKRGLEKYDNTIKDPT